MGFCLEPVAEARERGGRNRGLRLFFQALRQAAREKNTKVQRYLLVGRVYIHSEKGSSQGDYSLQTGSLLCIYVCMYMYM